MNFIGKRTLNVKFALLLLGALVIVGVGGYFLHGFQVRRNAGIFLQQADKAEKDGKPTQAADYLSRYLALVPHDKDALARYGLLLADDKLIADSPNAVFKAYLTLGQVLRQAPERHDVRRRVIQLAMSPRFHRLTDAAEHLDRLFAANIKDAELLTQRGECHEVSGEYRQARDRYEEALGQPKVDVKVYLRLALLLRNPAAGVRRKNETPETVRALADAQIEKMLQANAGSFQAQLYAVGYYRAFYQQLEPEKTRERVAALIQKARKLGPQEADVILAFADLEYEDQHPERARAELERGIERHPDDPRMYLVLSRLEGDQKRPREALAALRMGLKRLPRNLDLLWHLAYQQIRAELDEKTRDAEAADLIARMEKAGMPTEELDFLRARLWMSGEEWLKAVRLLERVYPQFLSRNTRGLEGVSVNLALESSLLLARCYVVLGDADRAVAAYRRVVTRAPQKVEARLELAQTLWGQRRLDAAEKEYRQLTQQPNAPATAWVALGQLLAERNWKNPDADWTGVEAILKQLEQIKPVPPEVKLLRAERLASLNRFAEARKELTSGESDAQPRSIEMWVGLAALEDRKGDARSALALLDDAERALGDQAAIFQARVRVWVRRGGSEAPRALDTLAGKLDRFKGAERRSLSQYLATAYLKLGESARAEALWRELRASTPTTSASARPCSTWRRRTRTTRRWPGW